MAPNSIYLRRNLDFSVLPNDTWTGENGDQSTNHVKSGQPARPPGPQRLCQGGQQKSRLSHKHGSSFNTDSVHWYTDIYYAINTCGFTCTPLSTFKLLLKHVKWRRSGRPTLAKQYTSFGDYKSVKRKKANTAKRSENVSKWTLCYLVIFLIKSIIQILCKKLRS